MSTQHPSSHWALALAIAALSTLPTAQAAEAAGMRVIRDAATGQLRPQTAEEMKAIEASTKPTKTLKSAQPRGLLTGRVNPQPVQHADGSVEQELDDSSQIFSVVRRNKDGSLDTACITGKQAADEAVRTRLKGVSVAKLAKEHDHDVK